MEATLAARQSDGETQETHWRHNLRGLPSDSPAAARLRAKLRRPDLPPEALPVWNTFNRLPRPFSLSDVRAYTELMDYPLQPWEVKALLRMQNVVQS